MAGVDRRGGPECQWRSSRSSHGRTRHGRGLGVVRVRGEGWVLRVAMGVGHLTVTRGAVGDWGGDRGESAMLRVAVGVAAGVVLRVGVTVAAMGIATPPTVHLLTHTYANHSPVSPPPTRATPPPKHSPINPCPHQHPHLTPSHLHSPVPVSISHTSTPTAHTSAAVPYSLLSSLCLSQRRGPWAPVT